MGTSTMETATSSLETWFGVVRATLNDFITDILTKYLPYEIALIALAILVSFGVYILFRILRAGGGGRK